MRAGTDDRQVIVGMDEELMAIAFGNGGGAQHNDSMRLLTRRLGVHPVAETVHEACIDPATLTGRTFYDHRDKGPFQGTVFALTRNPGEFAKPIVIRLLRSPRSAPMPHSPRRTSHRPSTNHRPP